MSVLTDRLVADWRRWYKWGSMRLSAIGAAVFGFLAAFPGVALEIWNQIPADIRALLPNRVGYVIAALTFLGVMYSRVTKKKDKTDA